MWPQRKFGQDKRHTLIRLCRDGKLCEGWLAAMPGS